jgi:hypothetical protein
VAVTSSPIRKTPDIAPVAAVAGVNEIYRVEITWQPRVDPKPKTDPLRQSMRQPVGAEDRLEAVDVGGCGSS